MDIQTSYAKLAARLGDIMYKLHLLQDEQQRVLAEIRELDKLAGMMAKKDEEKKPQTAQDAAGSDSAS